MVVEIVVGGAHPLLDVVFELLNIWDVFSFGDGVDPIIQEGQLKMGWFKLTVHYYFLDAEAALGVVGLGLFDHFNHRIDTLVLGHQIRDELDVMVDCDEESYTVDEHETSR